jgi:hypothetical protein
LDTESVEWVGAGGATIFAEAVVFVGDGVDEDETADSVGDFTLRGTSVEALQEQNERNFDDVNKIEINKK